MLNDLILSVCSHQAIDVVSNLGRLITTMPHADTSLVPPTIQSKSEFWEHVVNQLELLLDGQRNWACFPDFGRTHCGN